MRLAMATGMPPPAAAAAAAASEQQQQQALVQQLNSMMAEASALQQELNEAVTLSAMVWRITACIFVVYMQLGFSLIEAGTVRFKNTRNIMIKNVLDTCISAIAFWIFGFAFAFGEGSLFIGWDYPDGTPAFAGGQSQIMTFYAYVFCATSATIFAGAVAERTHLAAYLFFNFFLAALIYPVTAHLLWAKNGLLSPARGAIIFGTNGVLDNAGSMVVHVTGGVTSLVGAWMVGPRLGRFDIDGKVVPFRGHSMVFIAAGTIILWTGFYGFNGGSVEYYGSAEGPIVWVGEVARVCLNTTISASFAGVTVWTLTYRRKEPVPEDTFNGVLGGLVAACATSSLVEPYAACIVGIGAGMAYLAGVWVMFRVRIDDPVQASPVHLFCGSWGGLAVGFFATPQNVANTYNLTDPLSCGVFYGCTANQLLVQIVGLLVVYSWVGLTTFVLFFTLNYFNVLRVKRQQEEVGLDVAFHGGDEGGEDGDQLDVGMKRFSRWGWRDLMTGRWLEWLDPRRWFVRSKDGNHAGPLALTKFPKRDVWHRALDSTLYGQFSLAMYEANYVMEDAVEVEASPNGVYIGVHDGHSGCEAAEFLRESLYHSLKRAFTRAGGSVSAETMREGFLDTDEQFASVVRDAFDDFPHLATVGACSAVAVVTPSALWVANVGDSRAVLGQVRHTGDGIECRALQMSEDHNLSFDNVRQKFVQDHASMPDAVVRKRGRYRVKGKITVTRAFGDLYLKSHDFNREPLASRFRIPEPFNPPLVTAEPHVAVRILSPHDAFVIVASDGLFELISNQEAVDIVATNPRKDIARQLIRCAIKRAAERHEVPYQEMLRLSSGERRNYHDDITVVVFFFDHDGMKRQIKSGLWNKDVSLKGGKTMDASGTVIDEFSLIESRHGGTSAYEALQQGRRERELQQQQQQQQQEQEQQLQQEQQQQQQQQVQQQQEQQQQQQSYHLQQQVLMQQQLLQQQILQQQQQLLLQQQQQPYFHHVPLQLQQQQHLHQEYLHLQQHQHPQPYQHISFGSSSTGGSGSRVPIFEMSRSRSGEEQLQQEDGISRSSSGGNS